MNEAHPTDRPGALASRCVARWVYAAPCDGSAPLPQEVSSFENAAEKADEEHRAHEKDWFCADDANNHGQFVSCVAQLTNFLKQQGIITGQEKGAIQSCAAQADIP